MKEKGKYNIAQGEKNREKILRELEKENLYFNEIKQRLRLSPTVLSFHLKQMTDKQEIVKLYDTFKDRIVYSAKPETLIRELIIPKLLLFSGINILASLIQSKVKGEKEFILNEERTYDINRIYNYFIEEHSNLKIVEKGKEPRKLEPQDILNVLEKESEYNQWIRLKEEW